MSFDESLSTYYADFGEVVTIDALPVTAIFDGGYIATLEVAGTQPSLRCIAADVLFVARGSAVVRASTNYIVRGIEPIAPDEVEVRLILERQ